MEEPLDMVLHCPKCNYQHVDRDEVDPVQTAAEGREVSYLEVPWMNPPHKSHLCHACGCIWRPADVCTNGVSAINTRGTNDNWPLIGGAQ